MSSWIFQCNPDHYNIDSLLTSGTREFLYSANQNAGQMAPGDTVYLWRSQGKQRAISGIIAKGRLLDTPSERVDDETGRDFWIDKQKANARQMRVRISIDEIANTKEILQRSWMLDDPILKELRILKIANMSNYPLEGDQLTRIEELWENTGATWSRAQSLAALRVYHQTYGGSLSQLPNSPIAQTATLIGRAVKGVYNKVLNFRHIDPRDNRAGISGAGAVDREVWEEFFNSETGEIDADKLEFEFQNIWHKTHFDEANVSESEFKTRKNTYRPGPTPKPGGYAVSTSDHEVWYVYILELSNKKAVKVGMSHDPKSRLKHYNHTIMPEITGLSWKLAFFHPVSDADSAQEIEQTVLRSFSKHQLPSNGEILQNVDAMNVQLRIIDASRSN